MNFFSGSSSIFPPYSPSVDVTTWFFPICFDTVYASANVMIGIVSSMNPSCENQHGGADDHEDIAMWIDEPNFVYRVRQQQVRSPSFSENLYPTRHRQEHNISGRSQHLS